MGIKSVQKESIGQGKKIPEQIKQYNYCLRCGRKLKNPEYRIRGYGKICYDKTKKKEGQHATLLIGK